MSIYHLFACLCYNPIKVSVAIFYIREEVINVNVCRSDRGIGAYKMYYNFRLEDFMNRIGHEDVLSELGPGLSMEEVRAYKRAKKRAAEKIRKRFKITNPNLNNFGTQVISGHNAGIFELYICFYLYFRDEFKLVFDHFRGVAVALCFHDYPEYAKGDSRDYKNSRAHSVDDGERSILYEDTRKCKNMRAAESVLLYDDLMREKYLESDIGFLMKMLDKLDFLTSLFVREQLGLGGSILYKDPDKLNDYDKKSMEITGSTKPADIFLCNLLLNYPKIISHRWFPIFMEFMKSAAWCAREGQDEDSRNLVWLDKYLAAA